MVIFLFFVIVAIIIFIIIIVVVIIVITIIIISIIIIITIVINTIIIIIIIIITLYRIVFLRSARFLGWMPLFGLLGLPIVSCSLIKSNTRMRVTFDICFKQPFDTWYLVFYNPSTPRMFLSLDLLWEYRIQHDANGPLYITSSYSTWIFCRGVSGFATDCPCGVWCRGLTTCLLHVGPPFGNRFLSNRWAVGLT